MSPTGGGGVLVAKDPTGALRHGMELSGWNYEELWIAMYGLGGNLTTTAIERIVLGYQEPSAREYGMLRLALNEHLGDEGHDHPIESWQQLPDVCS